MSIWEIAAAKASEAPEQTICFPVNKTKVTSKCPSGWRQVDKIGKGAYGSVYSACCGNDCKYVAKVMSYIPDEFGLSSIPSDVKEELEMTIQCSGYKLCPKIVDHWECENGYVFIIEALNVTMDSLIRRNINDGFRLDRLISSMMGLLSRLHAKGISHGDTHLGNIMVSYDMNDVDNIDSYKYYFIDMGNAGPLLRGTSLYRILDDYTTLYGSLERINSENEGKLSDQLVKLTDFIRVYTLQHR
jgi:serine/threonine protein kinase